MQMYAIVTGLVQKVNFRSSVKHIADELEIRGSVKNLKDGSVEIIAIGDQKKLWLFVQKIKKNPGRGVIDSFSIKYEEKKCNCEDFQIIH